MLRPTVTPPHALAAAPASLPMGQNNNELIQNILHQKLMRNEATRLFYDPQPDHEESHPMEAIYPGEVETPMCLFDIVKKADSGGYENDFIKFCADIEFMIAYVLTFNDTTSASYIAGRMMLADWQAVIEELGKQRRGP